MNNDLKISVIITNYNHGQYIENAVKSIVNQTYKNLEIIVIDDGSTDGSADIIKKLVTMDDRIRIIILPSNYGKWFALNTAIKEATGNLIALQDADDECSVFRIEKQMKCLKQNNSVHNLCGFHHVFNEEQMEKLVLDDKKRLNLENSFENTLFQAQEALEQGYQQKQNFMTHKEVAQKVYHGFKTPGINHYFVGHDYEVHGASTLFYKQLWEYGMKFLPNDLGLMTKIKGEDGDHNLRLTLLLQKTSILKEPLYFYRRNSGTNQSFRKGL